jgi:hypothetical protein
VKTPWDDPTLEMWWLNDAWTLLLDPSVPGVKRVDRWFELHPLDRFYFRPINQRVIYAHDVPYGCYVRPQGHLEKLQEMARTIPVYLQQEPPKGWPPNAKRLPFEQLRERFGDYWASGPSYEVALAIMEGASEIQIWGIHLATEHEYREQRPNFEYLLGIARGLGIKIVMAKESPVLKHGWQYALEPKPAIHPAKMKLFEVRQAKSDLLVQMARTPSRSAADRLRRLEAQEMVCLMTMQHREPVVIQAPVLGGV